MDNFSFSQQQGQQFIIFINNIYLIFFINLYFTQPSETLSEDDVDNCVFQNLQPDNH